MTILEAQQGNVVILTLDGRLDHAGAPVLEACVKRHIEAGCRSILIDFLGISFLASMGIRALIIPTQTLSKFGGRIGVTGLGESTRSVFETAGLSKVFPIYDSVASAMADPAWPPFAAK
jgi:anti-anti-sigma factor